MSYDDWKSTNPDDEFMGTPDDREIALYTRNPAAYSRAARTFAIWERMRGCKFGECDLGAPCGRHRRSMAVAVRYDALVARWKAVRP